jgi:hypothetical protein
MVRAPSSGSGKHYLPTSGDLKGFERRLGVA